MLCPECNSKTKVWDTRTYTDPNKHFVYVERKHECIECNSRFKTIELPMDTYIEEGALESGS